jgi:uncharacterized protein (TIGR04222 family)
LFPFNLEAAQFLAFYAALGTLALVVLVLLVGRRARSGRQAQRSREAPSPYEIAWLSGGAPAAFATALTALTQRGLVEPDGAEFRPTRDASSDATLHPVEREVLRHLPKGRAAALRGLATAPLQIERALVERGLYRPRRGFFDFATEFVPLIGGVLTLGVVRMVWGVQREKPVGFLVLEMLVIGLAAVAIVVAHMGARRTAAGAKLLADLRREATRRNKTVSASADPATAPGAHAQPAGAHFDPVFDVALFGTAALAGTALAPVHTSLEPYQRRHVQHDSGGSCGTFDSGGADSHSGGASSCGGGDSGGGDGGGGCGGGGCGGCSS